MKKLTGFSIILYCFILIPVFAYADVKIYLDETRTNYVMADELDCSVYEGKGGITIGFKAGNMLFSIGPEFTVGKKNSIIWDRMVQGIIVRYKELCTRFNSGAITMKEYKERIKEIEAIAKEALEFQEKMIKRVKEESKDAFKELERETKGEDFITPEKISENIEDIGMKIRNLPALERK
jgi:uncharacterized membrane protein (DUF106 family)